MFRCIRSMLGLRISFRTFPGWFWWSGMFENQWSSCVHDCLSSFFLLSARFDLWSQSSHGSEGKIKRCVTPPVFSSSPPGASTQWRLGIAFLMAMRNLAVSVSNLHSGAHQLGRCRGETCWLGTPLGFSLLYLSHVANPTGLFVSPLGDVNISWKADCLWTVLPQMGKQRLRE